MMTSAVKAWIALLLLALAVYGGFALSRAYRASDEREQPRQAETLGYPYASGDFTLTTSQGEEFNSESMRGKVWIASFFFSRCPGACVTLNNQIAELIQKDFADQPVTFVSISVDPEYDTPQVLEEYAQRYYSQSGIDRGRWIFLTDPAGRKAPIQKASDGFKIAFAKLEHSDRMIVVDREGKVQGTYTKDVGSLRRKVREVLAKE
jgi:protein SCO1/2